jgi:hypothetical protein
MEVRSLMEANFSLAYIMFHNYSVLLFEWQQEV